MIRNWLSRGVKILEHKELTKDEEIVELLPQGDMVFPMLQHIGGVADPLVKKGDEILVGQVIGKGTKPFNVDVISSVSGQVKLVEDRLTVSGAKVLSVVVENDHKYITIPGYGKEARLEDLSKEEIISKVHKAGIVGLGGAGFSTQLKLSPKDDDKINYFIINGVECDSFMNSTYRVMVEETEKLIGGIKIILKLFENAQAVIAVNSKHKKLICKLKEASKGEGKIRICPLKAKYPYGVERQLVYRVTGIKISNQIYPEEKGCIVNNVETIKAVYDAVILGIPLIERVMTVSGNAINKPSNFRVRLGTNYQELVDGAGGLKENTKKIISGGAMMGSALYTLDLPVTRTSLSLVSFLEVEPLEISPCFRCGKCRDVCPNKLLPQKLGELADLNDKDEFVRHHGLECCNCGLCTFICPSNINLVQTIHQMKREITSGSSR